MESGMREDELGQDKLTYESEFKVDRCSQGLEHVMKEMGLD